MSANFLLRLPGRDAASVCSLEAQGVAQFVQRLNRSGMRLAIGSIEHRPVNLAHAKALVQAAGLQTLSAAVETSGHKEWIVLESMTSP